MTTESFRITRWTRSLAVLAACLPLSPVLAEDRSAQVAAISELIQVHYAFPEKRDAIAAKLTDGATQGRYASGDDHLFAIRVTADLRVVTDDKHMYLIYDPPRFAALASRREAVDPDPNATVLQARLNRAGNYGLAELKILEGNVRYLDARAFTWTAGAAESAYDAAARFLQDADAIIIDLRRNIGGEPRSVRRMLSYLEPPGTPLYRLYEGPQASDLISEDIPQAASLAGKPLYLLTSRDSVSAAEALAYHVSAAGLGNLVGEPTAGAANISTGFPLAPGFVLMISTGRSAHAITGADWEGTGVSPSIPIPAEHALVLAHVRALESLRSLAPAPQHAAIDFDLRTARARLNPIALDERQLQRYVGVYGDRHVSLHEGRLVWQHDRQPELVLEALDRDWFQVSPRTQARFVMRDGQAVAVELHRASGERTQVERAAP